MAEGGRSERSTARDPRRVVRGGPEGGRSAVGPGAVEPGVDGGLERAVGWRAVDAPPPTALNCALAQRLSEGRGKIS